MLSKSHRLHGDDHSVEWDIWAEWFLSPFKFRGADYVSGLIVSERWDLFLPTNLLPPVRPTSRIRAQTGAMQDPPYTHPGNAYFHTELQFSLYSCQSCSLMEEDSLLLVIQAPYEAPCPQGWVSEHKDWTGVVCRAGFAGTCFPAEAMGMLFPCAQHWLLALHSRFYSSLLLFSCFEDNF